MKRLNNVDALRIICAFCVICIHSDLSGTIGYLVIPICRVAVPIFLLISGFFYSSKKPKKDKKRQIVKIFKLIIVANILFFIFSICKAIYIGNLMEYLQQVFNYKSILKFIFLNESPFYGHLWYLNALLYTLVFVYFIDKTKFRYKVYKLIPILLLCDLVFGKYSLVILQKEIPFLFVRNFIFVGIPYFLLGKYIGEKKEKLRKISVHKLFVCFWIFIATTIIEKTILNYFEKNAVRDHYISTSFLAVTFFLMVINAKQLHRNNILVILGKNYSLWIYIIHPIIIELLEKIFNNNIYINYIIPFITLLISIIIIAICKKIFIKINLKYTFLQKRKNFISTIKPYSLVLMK